MGEVFDLVHAIKRFCESEDANMIGYDSYSQCVCLGFSLSCVGLFVKLAA